MFYCYKTSPIISKHENPSTTHIQNYYVIWSKRIYNNLPHVNTKKLHYETIQ